MNQLTTNPQPPEMAYASEPPAMGISDYLEIIKRRAGIMVLAAIVITAVAALIAMALPAVYRSTAVILIEEQSIPEAFIRSTITTFADERIQIISQRVLTRNTLLQLVDKYDLYPNDRQRRTNDQIIERMRNDIRFTPVSADRGRGGGRATIAFNIAYVSESPQKAQRVVNELVSLFLNENVRVRQQRTAETSAFLGEEANRLARQLQEMESKLAEFRARNVNALPESSQVNAQLAERNESEMMRIDRELRMLDDRRNFLQSQLNIVPPNLPQREVVTAAGERVALASDPSERLRVLRVQRTSLSGSYAEAHPDMLRLAREIAALEKEVLASGGSLDAPAADTVAAGAAGATGGAAPSKELLALREKLREARERYSATHPDVLRLQKAVTALESSAGGTARPAVATASTGKPAPAASGSQRPDNPAYLQLLAAMDQTVSEARSLASSRDELRQRQRVFVARLEAAPNVQREYLDLARDYDNSLTKYRDIKGKELEAQVAEELEKDRKGERFSLLEPAQLPETPFQPNRLAIMMMGFAVALGGGVGLGAAREALDFSIKGPRDLARKVALPILAQVPYLPSVEDGERRKLRLWLLLGGSVLALVVMVIGVHFFVTPLDMLFYTWF